MPKSPAEMTLAELLKEMRDFDDGLLRLTNKECQDRANFSAIKIDSYRMVIKALEARAKGIAEDIKDMQAQKKAFEASAEKMGSFIAFCLKALAEAHETSLDEVFLPGQSYEASLRKSQEIEIDEALEKPDAVIYNFYPEFIRRKYEWDREALTHAIKLGLFEHDNIRLKTNYKAQFKPRKEL